MKDTIMEMPDYQRPYEKCLREGEQSLSDRELLAVILRCGKSHTAEMHRGAFQTYGNCCSEAGTVFSASCHNCKVLYGTASSRRTGIIVLYDAGRT